MRGKNRLCVGILALCLAVGQAPFADALSAEDVMPVRSPEGFPDWVQTFRTTALAQGISTATFDAAFAGVAYDPGIVTKDRNQNEFSKQIWDYLDTAVSDDRVRNGKAAVATHRALLG
jgi:membrane-bound lytic murein transglycosylase B